MAGLLGISCDISCRGDRAVVGQGGDLAVRRYVLAPLALSEKVEELLGNRVVPPSKLAVGISEDLVQGNGTTEKSCGEPSRRRRGGELGLQAMRTTAVPAQMGGERLLTSLRSPCSLIFGARSVIRAGRGAVSQAATATKTSAAPPAGCGRRRR